jgi:hypothetical protein
MKQLIERYSFDPVNRQIKISWNSSLKLDNLLLVTNVTDHIIIYNFADPATTGSISDNILTLSYDTSSMASDDSLQIFVDVPDALPVHTPTIDDPMWGERGPLQQHEKDNALYPAQELLTYDTNIERVLGTSSLIENGRVKVDNSPSDRMVRGILCRTGDELIMPLNGHSTVAIAMSGTMGGVRWYASVDGVTWSAVWGKTYGNNLGQTAFYYDTVNFACNMTFSVGGMAYFKSYCTGVGSVNVTMVASHGTSDSFFNLACGSSGTPYGQRGVAPWEMYTFDNYGGPANHMTRDALHQPYPWNPLANYVIGDTVLWQNGQIYRCLSAHAASGATSWPVTNTTNWVRDERQGKSLATNQAQQTPDATRLRVQQDLYDYEYRLQEQVLLSQMSQQQNDMINMDYQLTVAQDVAYTNGKKFALGASGMAGYCFTEIR